MYIFLYTSFRHSETEVCSIFLYPRLCIHLILCTYNHLYYYRMGTKCNTFAILNWENYLFLEFFFLIYTSYMICDIVYTCTWYYTHRYIIAKYILIVSKRYNHWNIKQVHVFEIDLWYEHKYNYKYSKNAKYFITVSPPLAWALSTFWSVLSTCVYRGRLWDRYIHTCTHQIF